MQDAASHQGPDLRAYLTGFVLAVILTAIPFGLVYFKAMPIGPTVAVILVAAAVLIALAWVLRRTSAGTAVRAVGSDPVLAAASGIDRRAVTTQVWMLAAALAGLGGVMLGATDAVQWDMGLRVLLLMVAAVVLGGLGSVPGALVGGVLVGWATEISTYWLPADLVTAFALVVLIAVLLVKPTGLFGRAERIA